MPVIGLCGLNGCGKNIIAKELVVKHSFKRIHIYNEQVGDTTKSSIEQSLSQEGEAELFFTNMNTAMNFITSNWRENYVIECLRERKDFELFIKRPFFMIVSVLAPIQVRYERWKNNQHSEVSLLDFVKLDDEQLYDDGLVHVMSRARLTISSNGPTLDKLKDLVNDHLCLDDRWVRPSWDVYFMEMAELASKRSNCMKRRVGAVIVKDKRVISTGYNGTAKGLVNCYEGGCPRCNSNVRCGVGLEHCYCLHAEENALLEAGRVRCEGATIYSTTVPCLGCSQKLVQCGIIRVVYSQEYSLEHDASNILNAASVTLDKFTYELPNYIDASTL